MCVMGLAHADVLEIALTALQELVAHISSQLCAGGIICNWPYWEYSHHGNWQTLPIGDFFFFFLVYHQRAGFKHLPAHD